MTYNVEGTKMSNDLKLLNDLKGWMAFTLPLTIYFLSFFDNLLN